MPGPQRDGMHCSGCVARVTKALESIADDVLMRGMDVILAFPQIVFVLLFVSLLGPKLGLIVVLVALAVVIVGLLVYGWLLDDATSRVESACIVIFAVMALFGGGAMMGMFRQLEPDRVLV